MIFISVQQRNKNLTSNYFASDSWSISQGYSKNAITKMVNHSAVQSKYQMMNTDNTGRC